MYEQPPNPKKEEAHNVHEEVAELIPPPQPHGHSESEKRQINELKQDLDVHGATTNTGHEKDGHHGHDAGHGHNDHGHGPQKPFGQRLLGHIPFLGVFAVFFSLTKLSNFVVGLVSKAGGGGGGGGGHHEGGGHGHDNHGGGHGHH